MQAALRIIIIGIIWKVGPVGADTPPKCIHSPPEPLSFDDRTGIWYDDTHDSDGQTSNWTADTRIPTDAILKLDEDTQVMPVNRMRINKALLEATVSVRKQR